MVRRYGLTSLVSAMFFVSIQSLSWGITPTTPTEDRPRFSAAAADLLDELNTATEQSLKEKMGLPEGIVAKIMAHRVSGAKFANLVEVRSVTGMSSADVERMLMLFQEPVEKHKFEAQRKPVPEPAPKGNAAEKPQREPATTTPDKGSAAAGSAGTGPIAMFRPGFYGKLPGFDDLDKIDPLKRMEFLETVNREFCACGCKNETIAFCLVNDPACPVVKARAKKIYDDILNKPAR